jgi:hypothetical protein
VHFVDARNATRRRGREQRAHPAERERRPENSAEPGDDEALGQQLTDESPAIRPERGAQRDLVLPRGRAHEEQIGDVDAGNEQHERDGAARTGRAIVGVAGDELFERNDRRGLAPGPRIASVARHRLTERVELGACLLEVTPSRSRPTTGRKLELFSSRRIVSGAHSSAA